MGSLQEYYDKKSRIHRRNIPSGKKRVKTRNLSVWDKLPITPPNETEWDKMYWEQMYASRSYEGDALLFWRIMTRQWKNNSHQKLVNETWNRLEFYVKREEKNHFKMLFQLDPEIHLERILALIEFLEKFWMKTPNWCFFVYNKAFSEIEAVLQCRRWGIALPHNSCILNFRTKFIKYFVLMFSLKRNNISFEDAYLLKEGRYPTWEAQKEYEYYERTIDLLLRRCPSAGIQGYGLKEDLMARSQFLEDVFQGESQAYSCWGIHSDESDSV